MTDNAPQSVTLGQNFHIERDSDPVADRRTVEHLAEDVAAEFGPRNERIFSLAARDADGGWVGGVKGVIHWRWLYIAQIFIEPSHRGHGLGSALLGEAELLAKDNDCVGLYLDTFSPRALDFYRANGFVVAGRIDNFPPGAARTFLYKPLTPASA
ncbi:MAG TPA: GNAT family N-acetyltransferase [Rhodoblastus sp.]|nr:GNAT family N-acetyltransferase [Rhodoblastus sp.]